MHDYYSYIFSLVTLDIFICNYRTNYNTVPPGHLGPAVDLTATVNINRPMDANLATQKIKYLSYSRKIRVMRQVRRILIDHPFAENKLIHLNNEQLGVLKNLCSDPNLNHLRPYVENAGAIVTRRPFDENSMILRANTRNQSNFIKNFDHKVNQYKNIRFKPF